MKSILWLVVILSFLVLNCDNGHVTQSEENNIDQSLGKISLNLDLTNAPNDVVYLKGYLIRIAYDSIEFGFDINGDFAQAKVENIIPGDWNLIINAYNADNDIIYSGSTIVKIIPNTTVNVNLHLEPVTGKLMITVTWGEYTEIPNDRLLAFYPFNGNANDESGNQLHGTLYGPTLIEDRYYKQESAYFFDGYNDFINLHDNFNFDFDSTFSICAWIKTGELDGLRTIMSKTEDSYNSNNSYFLAIHYQYPRGLIREVVYRDINVMGSKPITDNCWHFVCMTYDGSNEGDGLKIYIDGRFHSSGLKRGNPVSMRTSDPAAIGCAAVGSRNRNFFRGAIDDVYIFNSVLTIEQINKLFSI